MDLKCRVFDWDEAKKNKYVVVFSRYQGKLLLSRHRERKTWETQGGHIEPGESAAEAARRELWEESGAKAFSIEPVCCYQAWEPEKESYEEGGDGAVFFADISELGELPESEMAEIGLFEGLPGNEDITYPGITPFIYEKVRDRFE